jgi:hypothetical protein
MNSNTPALDQKTYERKIDAIKVCGANRGPHDYIPISWSKTGTAEHVTQLMCRVCFTRVHIKTLYNQFTEATV